MADPRAIIVYNPRTKLAHKLVHTPDGDDLRIEDHVTSGRVGIEVDFDRLTTMRETLSSEWRGHPVLHATEMHHYLAMHHGIDVATIPSGRCAVIDGSGNVVNVIMADPDIDSVPEHRLIPSDTLSIGDVTDPPK